MCDKCKEPLFNKTAAGVNVRIPVSRELLVDGEKYSPEEVLDLAAQLVEAVGHVIT